VPTKRVPRASATTEVTYRSIIRLFGLIRRIMEPFFSQFGITGSQWGVLRVLLRAEEEGLTRLRLTDLGDRLLVQPPSITGVIDRMERLGLVARSASDTDLRSKVVSLTPAGRELALRVRKGHAARTQTILAGLSPKEQEHLHQLLDQLGSHLEATLEPKDGPVAPRGSTAPSSARSEV